MVAPAASRYLHPLTPLPTGLKPKGRVQVPIDCLLCDLYGTLFISASGDTGISEQNGQVVALIDLLLARYGQIMTSSDLQDQMQQAIEDKHNRLRVDGVAYPEVRIEDIWQKILPDLDSEKRKQLAIEFEMISNPVWPMPGVEQLLGTCVQKGIRLGIISNAQFYTPLLFSWLLKQDAVSLGFEPDLTLYSYQFGQAKPSMALFKTIKHRLAESSIDAANVAYIGNDMLKDMLPAHHAGFQAVLFAGDKRSLRLRKEDPDCSDFSPDMVVTQLDQLTACL